jgi:hypothetical protein
MEKPYSVLRKEFLDDLVNMVNTTDLPFFVLEPILKDVYITVKNEAEKIYQLEKREYEEYLKSCCGEDEVM